MPEKPLHLSRRLGNYGSRIGKQGSESGQPHEALRSKTNSGASSQKETAPNLRRR